MAKSSIAAQQEQPSNAGGALYVELGNNPVTLIGSDPQALLADAYFWRGHVRGLHSLVQATLERSPQPDLPTMHAIMDAMAGARVLSDLAEATLERAMGLLNIDVTGATP